jgi:hypothetical protein
VSSIPWMTLEYFRTEMTRFREVMCSTKYTLEQKDKAFEGLTQCFVCLPPGNKDETFMYEVLLDEWARRSAYEVIASAQKKALSVIEAKRKKLLEGTLCTCSYEESEEMTRHAPLCAMKE